MANLHLPFSVHWLFLLTLPLMTICTPLLAVGDWVLGAHLTPTLGLIAHWSQSMGNWHYRPVWACHRVTFFLFLSLSSCLLLHSCTFNLSSCNGGHANLLLLLAHTHKPYSIQSHYCYCADGLCWHSFTFRSCLTVTVECANVSDPIVRNHSPGHNISAAIEMENAFFVWHVFISLSGPIYVHFGFASNQSPLATSVTRHR